MHTLNLICQVSDRSRPAILGLFVGLEFGPGLPFVDEGDAELSKFS